MTTRNSVIFPSSTLIFCWATHAPRLSLIVLLARRMPLTTASSKLLDDEAMISVTLATAMGDLLWMVCGGLTRTVEGGAQSITPSARQRSQNSLETIRGFEATDVPIDRNRANRPTVFVAVACRRGLTAGKWRCGWTDLGSFSARPESRRSWCRR